MSIVTDKDIFLTANLLIEQHGESAEYQATLHQRERRKMRDENGAAVWERVIKAIRALQADEPEGGDQVH